MTARDVIKRALRMLGVIDAGREPEAGEATDALEALNDLLRGLYGHGIGMPLVNADLTTTAQNGERYAEAFTTPESPQDGWRLGVSAAVTVTAYTGQTIEGAASVAGSAGDSWFFDSENANWIAEADLVLGSTLPFPADINGAFAPILAATIAPEFSVPVSGDLALLAEQARQRIGQRYAPRIQAAVDEGLRPAPYWYLGT